MSCHLLIQKFTNKNYDKWLRKSVYNDKHTFNIGETIVDNNVNDATHVDLHKMQT